MNAVVVLKGVVVLLDVRSPFCARKPSAGYDGAAGGSEPVSKGSCFGIVVVVGARTDFRCAMIVALRASSA